MHLKVSAATHHRLLTKWDGPLLYWTSTLQTTRLFFHKVWAPADFPLEQNNFFLVPNWSWVEGTQSAHKHWHICMYFYEECNKIVYHELVFELIAWYIFWWGQNTLVDSKQRHVYPNPSNGVEAGWKWLVVYGDICNDTQCSAHTTDICLQMLQPKLEGYFCWQGCIWCLLRAGMLQVLECRSSCFRRIQKRFVCASHPSQWTHNVLSYSCLSVKPISSSDNWDSSDNWLRPRIVAQRSCSKSA